MLAWRAVGLRSTSLWAQREASDGALKHVDSTRHRRAANKALRLCPSAGACKATSLRKRVSPRSATLLLPSALPSPPRNPPSRPHIAGSKSKKLQLLALLPDVVALANKSDGDREELIQSAATLGSFAYGVDDGVRAVVSQGAVQTLLRALGGADEAVVEAAARSLKLIYRVRGVRAGPAPPAVLRSRGRQRVRRQKREKAAAAARYTAPSPTPTHLRSRRSRRVTRCCSRRRCGRWWGCWPAASRTWLRSQPACWRAAARPPERCAWPACRALPQ